jgi:hypothetical protein
MKKQIHETKQNLSPDPNVTLCSLPLLGLFAGSYSSANNGIPNFWKSPSLHDRRCYPTFCISGGNASNSWPILKQDGHRIFAASCSDFTLGDLAQARFSEAHHRIAGASASIDHAQQQTLLWFCYGITCPSCPSYCE